MTPQLSQVKQELGIILGHMRVQRTVLNHFTVNEKEDIPSDPSRGKRRQKELTEIVDALRDLVDVCSERQALAKREGFDGSGKRGAVAQTGTGLEPRQIVLQLQTEKTEQARELAQLRMQLEKKDQLLADSRKAMLQETQSSSRLRLVEVEVAEKVKARDADVEQLMQELASKDEEAALAQKKLVRRLAEAEERVRARDERVMEVERRIALTSPGETDSALRRQLHEAKDQPARCCSVPGAGAPLPPKPFEPSRHHQAHIRDLT
ncbi:hypothetical protein CYMTET_3958 [Cymbomonas tetramitiformis]|uniref:Uncharacterized protein n=1 Tax=Cymbomonas tetramitiformis TaxID=36881 RepID=A0AAE0H270_9CHLO|nr:hypothetical protein CYMTET_3958 [Cymbomonas tetramitiformis]